MFCRSGQPSNAAVALAVGYPDLKDHSNYMSKVLTLELYKKLCLLKTVNGYTLDHIIQTGVDNPGHPYIRTVGCVAGDEVRHIFNTIVVAPVQGWKNVFISGTKTSLDKSFHENHSKKYPFVQSHNM